MPYFERKAWSETNGRAAADEAAPVAADDGPNIADLAQAVLAGEKRPRQAPDGPFRCRQPIRPGGSGKIVLSVTAEPGGAPILLDFSAGDLRAQSGATIAARHLSIAPAHLEIPAGSDAAFEFQLDVPETATAGLYSARVVGDGPEPAAFIVEFEVAG